MNVFISFNYVNSYVYFELFMNVQDVNEQKPTMPDCLDGSSANSHLKHKHFLKINYEYLLFLA